MSTSTSVSVGHGPGAPRNEGTAKDRSTPVPDSNLTEIDATQECGDKSAQAAAAGSDKKGHAPMPASKQGRAAPPR